MVSTTQAQAPTSENKKRKTALSSPSKTGSKKKRKRSRSNNTTSASKSSILSGIILAVSTLQTNDTTNEKDTQHQRKETTPDTELSYRAVTEHCRTAGATVSSQVHKKVKCVLCTPAAVKQATQRVRKAQKKAIPLVDVAWLFACLHQTKRLDFDAYLLDYPEPPKESTGSTSKNKKNDDTNEDGENDVESVDAKDVPDAGWTEAVDVGCCCVCHENGDTDCPWCTDCNDSAKKKAKKDTKEEENDVESVDDKDVPNTGWTDAVDVGCCCVCHENGDTDCQWCTDCNV